jgi:hypothetical protein
LKGGSRFNNRAAPKTDNIDYEISPRLFHLNYQILLTEITVPPVVATLSHAAHASQLFRRCDFGGNFEACCMKHATKHAKIASCEPRFRNSVDCLFVC